MQRIAKLMLRGLARSTRGSVLAEFAITLPVLLFLYICGSGLTDVIGCNRKVATATRTLVDLVSRRMSPAIVYNAPQSASASAYLGASAVILAPYPLDKATQQISLLRICDASHAYVVWTQAQTQNVDGSTTTATASSQTAGTLPATQTQSASSVVSIPNNMVTSPMVPTSPDGSNVCGNLAPGTSNKVQVGTAGGWLFSGTVKYSYTPALAIFALAPIQLSDTIYMSPRLY